jgi:DNA-binding NarL/FixJ family response regulator
MKAGQDRRCLVADDHPALVGVVITLLEEQGFEVVGPATTGYDAIELARESHPPLAVVDLRMPGSSGLELVRALTAAAPDMRIVVYTAESDTTLAGAVIADGARGMVLKEAPLADLARALEVVSQGACYLDPALSDAAFAGSAKRGPSLTERERQVLELLADGHTYEEIASRLTMGMETVRTHVRKASVRLGARTRTEVVATALRLGLIA